MRSSILGIALAAALLATGISCKKKEDTTKPSLTGLSIEADHTHFMAEGIEVHARAIVSDLALSDKSEMGRVGLCFSVSGSQKDTVTLNVMEDNPEYSFRTGAPGNYTITCYAFPVDTDHFYATSSSVSFTVLDPDTALSGIVSAGEMVLDGNTYNICTIKGDTWMAGNLYGTDKGIHYENSEILESVFGKYYTWEEAQQACPDGWHLPSAAEFDNSLGVDAGALMADAIFNQKTMWEYWPQLKITNLTGFNAIPVGYLDKTDEDAPEEGFLKYACFWTCDQAADLGVFRYIYCEDAKIQKGRGSKTTLALSVRCIKDQFI